MDPIYAAYLADPACADSVVQRVTRMHLPRAVPMPVLNAHWDSEEAYAMLTRLSSAYSIVPQPLAPFIADCRRRNRSYIGFLHPHRGGLFDDPELARDIYMAIAEGSADIENLQLLRRLSENESALDYREHVREYLLDAFKATCAESSPWQASYVCETCYIYIEDLDALDTDTLNHLLNTESFVRFAALDIVMGMGEATQSRFACALANCASQGVASACRVLQDLSNGPFHASVADAIRQHRYSPYIDRLGLATLWCCIPYLVKHRSARTMQRMVASNGKWAVLGGVVSALISMAAHVPPIPHVANPTTVHEAIHYMHCTEDVPPDRLLVDRCLQSEPVALVRISRRCRAVRLRMKCARAWTRRRMLMMCMARYTTEEGVLAFVVQHPFTWRLVLSYM